MEPFSENMRYLTNALWQESGLYMMHKEEMPITARDLKFTMQRYLETRMEGVQQEIERARQVDSNVAICVATAKDTLLMQIYSFLCAQKLEGATSE